MIYEPCNDEVERACRAHAGMCIYDETPFDDIFDGGKEAADQERAKMRAALKAANAVRERDTATDGGAEEIAKTILRGNFAPFEERVEDAAALIQSYGDRRAAEERERCAGLSQFARDCLAERERQKSVEGWTPEHDDAHGKGELARAGACYALAVSTVVMHREINDAIANDGSTMWPAMVFIKRYWPWDFSFWKPKTRRRDLERAVALLLAEGERLDRAAIREGADHD